MELVKPEFGLVFWMTLSFLIVVFILSKFAWKPILNSLKERETSIEDALNAAKKAKDEVANMKAENEALLQEARMERNRMMKEARDTKDAIISEARTKAKTESDRLLAIARESIQNEKMSAITELKIRLQHFRLKLQRK